MFKKLKSSRFNYIIQSYITMPMPSFHEVPQIADFINLPKEKIMKLGTNEAYILFRIIDIFANLKPSESAFTSMQENVGQSLTYFALASLPQNDIKKFKKALVKKETLTPEQLEKLNADLVEAKSSYKCLNNSACLFLVKLQERFHTYINDNVFTFKVSNGNLD
jgi:hypothetical protein